MQSERGRIGAGRDIAERERRRGHAEGRGKALAGAREGRVEIGAAKQQLRQLGGEVGLLAALGALAAARSRELGDRAGGDRDEHAHRRGATGGRISAAAGRGRASAYTANDASW